MKVIEALAVKSRMAKVVLTVLVGNVAAVKFYRKLGLIFFMEIEASTFN